MASKKTGSTHTSTAKTHHKSSSASHVVVSSSDSGKARIHTIHSSEGGGGGGGGGGTDHSSTVDRDPNYGKSAKDRAEEKRKNLLSSLQTAASGNIMPSLRSQNANNPSAMRQLSHLPLDGEGKVSKLAV